MSVFLLPQEQFYAGTTKFQNNSHPKKTSNNPPTFGNIIKNQLKTLKQCALNKIIHKNEDQTYALRIFDLGFNLKALFSIKSSKISDAISFFVDILEPAETYYKTSNLFQTIQICRNIILEHSNFGKAVACIKLNPDSRQIKMQLPLFLSYNWSILAKSPKTSDAVRFILQSLIQPQISLISLALRNVLRGEGRARAQDFVMSKPNKILDKANRYSLISNIATHIACQPESEKMFDQRNQLKQKQTVKKLTKNRVKLHPQILKNADLFSFHESESSILSDSIDQIHMPTQIKIMKSKIGIVSMSSNSNTPEGNFQIQNRIELDNAKELELQKIGQGGFANIFAADLSYWYFQPNADQRKLIPNKKSSNLMTERLVLKIESPQNRQTFESQQSEELEKCRRQHEIRIIQKMKRGKSIYLPRYYFPTNLQKQKNMHLNNCLLMEYIPYKNLGQLLESNSSFLSLHSKISLMLSVCQGLRYLRDYDIVHLDLKPNNIMTHRNFHIKLIDFGESYHQQVCEDGYKPGFSIPYSAPEIFSEQKQIYSSKSDVFSFGVILYQILFNKFPFQVQNCTAKFDSQMKKYLQRWYYSPEEGESCGQGDVIRILTGLISKCLQTSPQDRPELDWIALVLKLVLQAIY